MLNRVSGRTTAPGHRAAATGVCADRFRGDLAPGGNRPLQAGHHTRSGSVTAPIEVNDPRESAGAGQGGRTGAIPTPKTEPADEMTSGVRTSGTRAVPSSGTFASLRMASTRQGSSWQPWLLGHDSAWHGRQESWQSQRWGVSPLLQSAGQPMKTHAVRTMAGNRCIFKAIIRLRPRFVKRSRYRAGRDESGPAGAGFPPAKRDSGSPMTLATSGAPGRGSRIDTPQRIPECDGAGS